jgi:hypothetical protein
VTACAALTAAFVLAPAASAADLELRWVDPVGPVTGQPQDAEVGATIRTDDLNVGSSFIQIEVIDTSTGLRATNFNKPIGFELKTGAGFASGSLTVRPQVPVDGVATFGAGTLSIGTENEPQFTAYSLVPVATRGPRITGPASDGFDVWEDGESCTGGADTCVAKLRGNDGDTYTLTAAGSLGASELVGALPGLECPGQAEIFDDRIYSYATTGTAPLAPVQLVNHITKAEWKASANNGQAHADWCIGLVSQAAWAASGATPTQVDTDLDGVKDLWVALAPRCPQANPSASAPCIVSQTGDGRGGSTSIGWLPGGDPPRRT